MLEVAKKGSSSHGDRNAEIESANTSDEEAALQRFPAATQSETRTGERERRDWLRHDGTETLENDGRRTPGGIKRTCGGDKRQTGRTQRLLAWARARQWAI